MGDFLDYFKNVTNDLLHNKKNLINLLILGILILALPLGINLIRQQQIIKSRAVADPIVFAGPNSGSNNVFQRNGQWMALTPQVSLQLTSPLGPPAPPASPTPPPVTPPPVTPPPLSSPVTPPPVTVASATLNGQPLDLTGAATLSTTLALPSGATSVDVPLIINYSSGSPRNLIIRFNYQPPAPVANAPCTGKSAGTCTFDSMVAYYNPDGSRDFAVTAYGKYWNWNSPSRGVFNLTGSGDLTSVSWYIQ